MKELIVDRSKCTKCGTCLRVCPTGAVQFGEDGIPEIKSGGRCLECTHCVLFCPMKAGTLSFMGGEPLERAADIKLPDTALSENFLRTRRSIRRFKDKPISREIFDRIFDTVKYAPTAVNARPVRWIVTETPGKTKEITKLILRWFSEAIETRPGSGLAQLGAPIIARANAGEDPLLRWAPHAAIALVPKKHSWPEDGAIALTYLELEAYALGIGCCWGGYLTTALRKYAPLREFLGITDDDYVCGAQLMGWPALKPKWQYPPRYNNISWI